MELSGIEPLSETLCVDHLVRRNRPCHSDSSDDREHSPWVVKTGYPQSPCAPGVGKRWLRRAQALGAHDVSPAGVRSFQADMACIYRLHLQARLALPAVAPDGPLPRQGRDDLCDGIRQALELGVAGSIPP